MLQTGSIGRVILDDWFPSDEDKLSVYQLVDQIEPHLTEQERENLMRWKHKKTKNNNNLLINRSKLE